MTGESEKLLALQARNIDKAKELAAQGIHVQVEAMAYVVNLLEWLCGDGLDEAKCHHARKVLEALEQAEAQAPRARLLQPPQPGQPGSNGRLPPRLS